MVWTNAWDNDSPTDATAAASIDNEIRKLKLDLAERLDSITLAGSKFSTDDPIAIDPAGISLGTTGKKQILNHIDMRPLEDQDDVFWRDNYFESDNQADGNAGRIAIVLPVGATITNIDVYVQKGGGNTSVSASLEKVVIGPVPSGPTQIDADFTTGTGVQTIALAGLSLEILDDNSYHLEILNVGSDRFRFYGAVITYDTTDLLDN